MSIRFRKSFKIAPGVKLNLNKRSVGVSVGGNGVHYTVNSNGRKTTTAGIPGTGLYYQNTSYSNSKNSKTANTSSLGNTSSSKTGQNLNNQYSGNSYNSPQNNNQNDNSTIHTVIMWFLLIFFPPFGILYMWITQKGYSLKKKRTITAVFCFYTFILFCGVMADTENESNENNIGQSSAVVQEEQTTQEETTQEEQASQQEESAEFTNSENDSETTYFVSDGTSNEPANEEEPQTEEETEEETEAATQPPTTKAEPMVWIDNTGKKYHKNSTCSNMDSPYKVTLSEAQSMGKDACKKCYK